MAVERTARVHDVHDHGADTRSLFLTPAEPLEFRPGQFLSCLVPAGGERLIRPYSIASPPAERERLEILFDRVPGGPGSAYLHGLRTGDEIRFTGPWGTFTLDEPPAAETVFIADRTGIAPICAMLRAHGPRPPHAFRLLYGTSHAIYADELARRPGVVADVVAPAHLLEEATRRFVEADADRSRHFYVCGIGAIVYAIRDRLRAAGYARRAVQYEKW